MTTTEVAPVCNLPNRGQAIPLQASILHPIVGKALDLPTAIAVSTQLIQAITYLLGPEPFANNLNPFTAVSLNPASGGTPGISESTVTTPGAPKGKKGQDVKRARFTESGRTLNHIKVVDPDDEDNFVFVERINDITFSDNETGGSFFWEGVNLG